jgi:hypothetical protein
MTGMTPPCCGYRVALVRGDCMDDYFSQTAGNHELDQRSAIHAPDGGLDATPDRPALQAAALCLDRIKESV